MRPFTTLTGPATLLPIKNIDTDIILPARYLKVLTRKGFGGAAFYTYRFGPDGAELAGNPFHRKDGTVAPIIIAGENFGCGSSREHASWALDDFGVRAVISPRFADIFAGNAFKNGLLLIELPESAIAQLVDAGLESISIDLPAQSVNAAGKSITFEIDPFRKNCLLSGLDEISLTEKKEFEIAAFERRLELQTPWILPKLHEGIS
jgi:3-isopropylmalate/(R)-2-methylmalate dehydratase small subunit